MSNVSGVIWGSAMRRAVGIALTVFTLGVSTLTVGCDGARKTTPASVTTGGEVRKPTPPPIADVPKLASARVTETPIEIRPKSIALDEGGLGAQLVFLVSQTSQSEQPASWSTEPPGIVEIDEFGFVEPRSAGAAAVLMHRGGATAKAEVTVRPAASRKWNFSNDIAPLFTRHGCNTGGCHGRADGQNGFHLSLFGYDPEGDYFAITRGAGARRIDAFRPDDSLLLRKATGQTVHGGGQRITPGSTAHRMLSAWIGAGAPMRHGDAQPALVGIDVEPPSSLLAEPAPVQLRVRARFSDGTERDVTRLALFRSNDDRVASVDERGRATLKARGEADIVVRYGPHIVTSRLASPVNPELALDFAAVPRANFIDDLVFARLAALKVPPSPPAPDSVYLRRLSFDLTGQLPEPDEVKRFVASDDPDKRLKMIDALMARRDFLHFWKLKFGDLLQITPARFANTAGAYEFWLERALTENRPWDAMVRELLTAIGDPADRVAGAAANYALDGPDPQTQAEQTARRFMGIRMRCAQCHDHPFDTWTQDAYYGLAAFFAKVDRGGGAPGMMEMRQRVRINAKGSVEHLRTKQRASPRLLDGTNVTIEADADPRAALADWMTRPDNPYFARAMANWVWAQLFGRGIVDPADDMSRSNPPVHPELLDRLARHFAESAFDVRALIRTIASSQVYGLASSTVEGNEHDQRLFSHQLARPLTAHQMADALARATQVANVFSDRLGDKNKAIEIFNPTVPSAILDAFGRCTRVESCSNVGGPAVSLRQALLLIGGDAIDGKVTHPNGYLSRLMELSPSAEEIVDFLYMRALCRPPTNEERSHWTAELTAASSLNEAAEDLFWALLNSREFAFNH